MARGFDLDYDDVTDDGRYVGLEKDGGAVTIKLLGDLGTLGAWTSPFCGTSSIKSCSCPSLSGGRGEQGARDCVDDGARVPEVVPHFCFVDRPLLVLRVVAGASHAVEMGQVIVGHDAGEFRGGVGDGSGVRSRAARDPDGPTGTVRVAGVFRSRASISRLVRLLAREWREDRVGGLAAEIAFFGLLGFFPLLLAVAAALGSLEAIAGGEVAAKAQATVLAFLERILSDDAAGTVEAVRHLFTEANPGALTIGTALAIWAASRSFAAVIDALDIAYDIEERRSWLHRRLVALGLAAGSVVVFALVLAALVLGPLLGTGHEVAGLVGGGEAFAVVWDWVRWPALLILTTGWWVTASLALRLYLAVAGNTNEVLG